MHTEIVRTKEEEGESHSTPRRGGRVDEPTRLMRWRVAQPLTHTIHQSVDRSKEEA